MSIEPIKARPFQVYAVDSGDISGALDFALSFDGKRLDDRLLQIWDLHLQRTFGMLARVGGCGGAAVDPNQSRAAMAGPEMRESMDDDSVIYAWRLEPDRIDPQALVILCNLIEHGVFNFTPYEGKSYFVSEVFVDAPRFRGIDVTQLDLPDLWPNLPFELNDHNPTDGDFDIEIEFTEEVSDDIHAQLEVRIKAWVLTLERGGFLYAHPRKSWEYGRDTSVAPFRRTPLSLFVQVRGLYSDYRAVWSLLNLLALAHGAVHPIAAVHIGE